MLIVLAFLFVGCSSAETRWHCFELESGKFCYLEAHDCELRRSIWIVTEGTMPSECARTIPEAWVPDRSILRP
jgi:hypothetical protein